MQGLHQPHYPQMEGSTMGLDRSTVLGENTTGLLSVLGPNDPTFWSQTHAYPPRT